MEIAKPSEADKERFRQLLAGLPGVDVKPMFGNLGAFVNGNMFAGLFGSTLGVRLSDTDRDELSANSEILPFGPAGHAMAGYVGLSVQDSPGQARVWVEKALEFVSALPPKAAKAPKTPTGPKAR